MSKVDRQRKAEAREKRQEEQGAKIMRYLVIGLIVLSILGIAYFSSVA